MAEADSNDPNVKAVVHALPVATLNVRSDGKGGSGTIETVLGYDRPSDSVRIVECCCLTGSAMGVVFMPRRPEMPSSVSRWDTGAAETRIG